MLLMRDLEMHIVMLGNRLGTFDLKRGKQRHLKEISEVLTFCVVLMHVSKHHET